MCGIAGFISIDGRAVSEQLIGRMTELVAHRGPDGAGTWRRDGVALGHRRLSIIDLSDLGRQPMEDAESGCVVTYNGEIYNYIEIRKTLVERGYRFRSNTDTEVILKAYDAWGEACVEKFNGMWAFALYDPKRNVVFCSRDRFGVKPFYYAQTASGFAFGSEIRQLLALLPRVRADAGVLFGFLLERVAEQRERTFFAGVRKLPPGHNLVFDLAKRRFAINEHYSLRARSEYAALDDRGALEAFQELFDDAIRLRLRSDVRVGTCLSGGMDSSSIATRAAGIYRAQSGQAFSAVTAISEDPATDESRFARAVVDRCGLHWITVKPGYDDFCEAIGSVVTAQEEPFSSASVLMQFFVMRAARQASIPVLLDGQGADETLLGYERYFADCLAQGLKDCRPGVGLDLLAGLLRNGRRGALRALLWNLLYFHAPRVKRFAARSRRNLFRPEFDPLIRAVSAPGRGYSNLFVMQKREIESTNLPVLLRYEDKNSMWHSIETRLPFLDYRLVELTASIATRLKLHDGWGKHLLRRSMDGRMPAEIVWRKEKFGFEAPEFMWTRRHAQHMRDAVRASKLLSEICDERTDNALLDGAEPGMRWRFYSVARWEHDFQVDGLAANGDH